MTGSINTSQDEVILLDNGAERRKAFSEIFGSNAYNSTAFTTCVGTVVAGDISSFTTCTGTTTPSNSQTFTNKGGNISQWTNNSGFTTCTGTVVAGDISSFTTCTGTTTPSNSQTFTNKSGNISQWTNDSGYTACTGTITGITAGDGISGGGCSGGVSVAVDSSVVRTTGTQSIAGAKTFSDDLCVQGAVTQQTAINAQTGTTYTLVLTDHGKLVTSSNGSAQTITVPPNSSVAYPVGTDITITQLGAGQVTLAGGCGVSLYAADSELKTRVQYSTAVLTKTATDTWLVAGDLTA